MRSVLTTLNGPAIIALCAFMCSLCHSVSYAQHAALFEKTYATSGNGNARATISKAPAMEGVLVVKFNASIPGKSAASGIASFDQLAQQLKPTALRQLFPRIRPANKLAAISGDRFQALERIYEFRFSADVPAYIAAALLSSDPAVEYAEPRYLYPLTGIVESYEPSGGASSERLSRVDPNDPQFVDMSHLAHVSLPRAWDVVKSSDGNVVIGIVDAGTDWRHEDLVGNIWINRGELDGNGIDDDENGFVDDLRGWNFANDTNDPTGLPQTQANGTHGTIVAGISSAVTNNEAGIAGASWNARMMPVNAGCTNADNAVCFGFEGVLYAALQGADIINVSWGGPDSFIGREAVKMALDLGALVVVSAGNGNGLTPEGINLDDNLTFPAGYDGVLVVGSTGKAEDLKAEFSNYGVGVDVFAPGETLDSTIPGDGYTTEASGTSFSTPIVAGLAALLKTFHPNWTMDQLREQIRVSSDPIDGFNDAELVGLLGQGRINAGRAMLNNTLPAVRIRNFEVVDGGNDGIIRRGEQVTVNVDVLNYLAVAKNLTLSLSVDDPNVVIQNSTFPLPDLDSGDPFKVQFAFSFADDVSMDHELKFRFDIEGEDYRDAEIIRLITNRATHDTGVLQMTLTEEGNIGWSGFQEESEGKGFKYLGVNWLFEGGVLIGAGPDKISDSVRNTVDNQQDQDLVRPEGAFFGILESPSVTENGLVILNDKQATNPLGINIHQESYADARDENNDFIILRYIITHEDSLASESIEDLHVGLLTDWDLTRSEDFARFDADRRMGIVQPSPTEPGLLLASKLLDETSLFSYRSIDNEEIFDSRSDGDGFTNAEKWAFMTEGIQVERVDNADVSTLITAGPFILNPGGRVDVAFALMAARSEDELNAFADRAQEFWNTSLSVLPPNPVSVEDEDLDFSFSLDPPYPNPATSEVTIRFTLPQTGTVDLAVFDMLGREVKRLDQATKVAGAHTVQWNGTSNNNQYVSNGVYFYRLNVVTPQGNFTATRKIVLAH
ncbi:MAG: S8 family serine peptidase [Rhodothermales bacterium]